MQRKTRSILDELDTHFRQKDLENVIENRASHIISGAINLINSIKESFSLEESAELERRLLNSIRTQNPDKFNRCLKRIKNEKTE